LPSNSTGGRSSPSMSSTRPTPAARSAASTTFCDARIEARSDSAGLQSSRATGRPNASRRVPSVTRESWLGACSAWARRTSTPLASSDRRTRADREGADRRQSSDDVAEVAGRPCRHWPPTEALDQRRLCRWRRPCMRPLCQATRAQGRDRRLRPATAGDLVRCQATFARFTSLLSAVSSAWRFRQAM
jgi:hypothetical protein